MKAAYKDLILESKKEKESNPFKWQVIGKCHRQIGYLICKIHVMKINYPSVGRLVGSGCSNNKQNEASLGHFRSNCGGRTLCLRLDMVLLFSSLELSGQNSCSHVG